MKILDGSNRRSPHKPHYFECGGAFKKLWQMNLVNNYTHAWHIAANGEQVKGRGSDCLRRGGNFKF